MAGVTGTQVSTTRALTDRAYADDSTMLGDNYDAVQEMVNGVHRFANAVWLRINAAKTKLISAQMSPLSRGTIILDGVPLEEVSSSKNLGAPFTATGQAVGEIAARINLARAAFNRLHSSLWLRREISHRRKGRISESVVMTILLYGCETWPLRV